MGRPEPPERGRELLAWAKRWRPQWEPRITFPQNSFFVGLFDFIHLSNDLDATLTDGKHQLLLRFEHAYDPDGFLYSEMLAELNCTLNVTPYKPDYGHRFTRLLRRRHFEAMAKELVDHAYQLIRQMPIEHRGPQIRTLDEVMEILGFPEEVIEVTRETLFGNPDPAVYRYLSNPVSFLNLENGWIIVPNKETALKLNLGIEYEHVFRLSYLFDAKKGPVVEDYQKYRDALSHLSRQVIRRVFSLLGKYTSIIYNPFFSDISQRFPVRYVALNNGLLVATLGRGSDWKQGTFEFYRPTERHEEPLGTPIE